MATWTSIFLSPQLELFWCAVFAIMQILVSLFLYFLALVFNEPCFCRGWMANQFLCYNHNTPPLRHILFKNHVNVHLSYYYVGYWIVMLLSCVSLNEPLKLSDAIYLIYLSGGLKLCLVRNTSNAMSTCVSSYKTERTNRRMWSGNYIKFYDCNFFQKLKINIHISNIIKPRVHIQFKSTG